MCKEMTEQRYYLECEIWKELERCIKNIQKGEKYEVPKVQIRREDLWLGNKIHFEEMGFRFEEDVRCEKEQFTYYVWMVPVSNGEIANEIHKQLRQAQKDYITIQRKKICERIDVMKLRSQNNICIHINMKKLCFDNKIFFEEKGYIFKKDPEAEGYAWMQKK